jgi:hypothetical protein
MTGFIVILISERWERYYEHLVYRKESKKGRQIPSIMYCTVISLLNKGKSF